MESVRIALTKQPAAGSSESAMETKRLTGPVPEPAPDLAAYGAPWSFSGIRLFPTATLFGRLQRKLEIGAINDPLEREADCAAERVMRMPHPAAAPLQQAPAQVQRACAACTESARDDHDEEHDKRKLSRKEASASTPPTAAPPSVHQALREPGQPLDSASRAFFEPRFNHDFSRIRLHFGPAAEQSAREVNARAYTVGPHIVFGPSAASADTNDGRRLLAHELSHTIQQGASPAIGEASPVPAKTPLVARQPAAPPGTAAAPASPPPAFVSGTVSITDKPLTVTQQGGSIIAASMGFKIEKPFTVNSSSKITETGTTEPFEYGLVQNVWFDHIEEVFTSGDMLVDTVGPMVDIDPTNQSEMPFIHANAAMPSLLFTQLSAGPTFSDVPSLEVALHKTHCKKNVDLLSVTRSLMFKVGLVARGLNSKNLFPLAEIPGNYSSKWQVKFQGNAFTFTETAAPASQHKLVAPASTTVTSGTVAGVDGQTALTAETKAFEERCVDVLSSNAPAAPDTEVA